MKSDKQQCMVEALPCEIRFRPTELATQESLKMSLRNQALTSGKTQNPSSPSQQAQFFIIPCLAAATRCSFQSVSSNTLMPASTSSYPSVNFDSHGLLLRSLSFVKGALLPDFNQLVQGVQQPEDIFSISNINLRACLNILSLGQKT
jgi:hypothetical protein